MDNIYFKQFINSNMLCMSTLMHHNFNDCKLDETTNSVTFKCESNYYKNIDNIKLIFDKNLIVVIATDISDNIIYESKIKADLYNNYNTIDCIFEFIKGISFNYYYDDFEYIENFFKVRDYKLDEELSSKFTKVYRKGSKKIWFDEVQIVIENGANKVLDLYYYNMKRETLSNILWSLCND